MAGPSEVGLPESDGARGLDAHGRRLERLVEGQFDPMWRLLRRLGVPRDAAQDAVQEVFMVAARRISEVAVGSEKSFLYGTALRVAKSARRRRAVDLARHEPIDGREPTTDATPEQALVDRGALATLDALLENLDEQQRAVFVLFEFEGFTLTEIAELLKLPRGTAASRLRRARDRFLRAARRLRGPFATSGGDHE
jgi:RNA polymerase sigma-70 factor, ECF subfamily